LQISLEEAAKHKPQPSDGRRLSQRHSLITEADQKKLAAMGEDANKESLFDIAKSIMSNRVWQTCCFGGICEGFATNAYVASEPFKHPQGKKHRHFRISCFVAGVCVATQRPRKLLLLFDKYLTLFFDNRYQNHGPQFIETVLGIHKSTASVIAGLVLVPAATLGT